MPLFGSKSRYTGSSTAKLTGDGTRKVMEFGLSGLPFRILDHIHENGSTTLREISERFNLSPSQTKNIIYSLERGGYVYVGDNNQGNY